MISYLKGSIELFQKASPTKTIVIIEVQGIGYEVQVPSNINVVMGSTVQIFIHQQFREDQVSLYGFSSTAERDLFRQLISVSGVGASIGIALIEHLGITELVQAIVLGSTKILSKTPGIGTKTAERLSVELKSKLKQWRDLADLDSIELDENMDTKLQSEVEMTLLALGYDDIEIRQALQMIGRDEELLASKDVEKWLRFAIAALSN
jgi:holliday junction DNA helicase RuvA